ncbi:MAG: fumarylacetoacetate hydrolase family protein [Propionibacteriaceae bacterium]
MRIARYVANNETYFGIVELAEDGGENPDTVATITGDPLAGPVNYTGERHLLADVRLLSPVIPRSKIVGAGRNYVDHARELGNEVPEIPLLFMKPNTTVVGPDEAIVHPAESDDLHCEGELAIVIGRICKQVPPERVQDVIFGYTVANDVTARDIQKTDPQFTRAKSYDTFCPLGPWIVTHYSVAEAGKFSLTTTVNGAVKQEATTDLMVRSITDLVCYISSFMTLLPGDVILTGTPAGVTRMVPGDVVAVTIDGIGTLSNPVVGA